MVKIGRSQPRGSCSVIGGKSREGSEGSEWEHLNQQDDTKRGSSMAAVTALNRRRLGRKLSPNSRWMVAAGRARIDHGRGVLTSPGQRHKGGLSTKLLRSKTGFRDPTRWDERAQNPGRV